jgi:polyisoprenoid-binding protein YceI
MHRWIAALLLAGAAAGAVAAQASLARVTQDSRFEFTLRTRWGQVLQGRFATGEGEVTDLGGGRRRVRLVLPTTSVEILDHPRYTSLTRGPRFFDAKRVPDVQFVSEPYTLDLLRTGGTLHGQLRMHGVQRREAFVLTPAQCANPGRDCDIVAEGVVRRDHYDLDGWRVALRDEVVFALRVRLRDAAPGEGAR